jgi:poly(beta-D-mannuronate) lyase
MTRRLIALVATLGTVLGMGACGPQPPAPDASTFTPRANPRYPADVLDLTNWKLTLPVDNDDDGRADEIKQPCLAKACYDGDKKTYSNPAFKKPFSDKYFHLNDSGKGVVLRAPVEGATTSGSDTSRTELRELFDRSDDKEVEASWSNDGNGVHTMKLEAAITKTPPVYPSVAVAQIHDGSAPAMLVKLRGKRLFVDSDNGVRGNLDSDYVLGTRFTLQITATQGHITVTYNRKKKVTYERSGDTFYFKAGVYNQSNLDKYPDEDPNAYGEVVLYRLAVTHED